ncbi:hypothetical protein IFM89_009216 [Coptis chinensis]|uniref:CRM domain-containing protein n=1 Tax=Coptis chinensis TaxID=261450 RepID=A0A835M988_9MAGN|nr:hypothetical protein IFM89_009216 [Coptis chinensis]
MWAATKNKSLQRHYLNTLSSFLFKNTESAFYFGSLGPKIITSNVYVEMSKRECSWIGGTRLMSTAGGRSMRSKVERRMNENIGRTEKEKRRAKAISKKLMTEEERLIWNLRRAKKKVALLLQKLKKYELPELPPPRHDPELLTPEQLQAYKKIGFRNKNYVPVGIRGVFGGVVQNMHLHWKFHETVQVCCDNYPKEKIKEMATMLARLSGGIVINVHDVKTIIMFRGRNYRQPKNLIPINTLTKRKALFKARFEQALDSQKLNIKKIEQELRRRGVNPEDPQAIKALHRIASQFFNAIEDKQGTPYVFKRDKSPVAQRDEIKDEEAEEQERQQLDKFIADIEEAAEKEWEEEEAAEKDELQRIKYRNREHSAGRIIPPRMLSDNDSEDDIQVKQRNWEDTSSNLRTNSKLGRHHNEDEEEDDNDDDVDALKDDKWSFGDLDGDTENSDEDHDDSRILRPRPEGTGQKTLGRAVNVIPFKVNDGSRSRGQVSEDSSGSEDIFGDSEELCESDDQVDPDTNVSQRNGYDYSGNNVENDDYDTKKNTTNWLDDKGVKTPKQADEDWDSD